MLKAILLPDIHYPMEDKDAIKIVKNVIRKWKPDEIVFTGDQDSAETTSHWTTGTPVEALSIEDQGLQQVREMFAWCRSTRPEARMIALDGNHGLYRHKNYTEKKAPTFLDWITPENLYHTDKYNVEFYYYDKPPVLWHGDIYLHHGESISKNAGESVRNDCLNWNISLIRSHSHRAGFWQKNYSFTNQVLRGWELGTLCDFENPEYFNYALHKDWCLSFGIAHITDDDVPHVQIIEIRKDDTGKYCVVDGKVYRP